MEGHNDISRKLGRQINSFPAEMSCFLSHCFSGGQKYPARTCSGRGLSRVFTVEFAWRTPLVCQQLLVSWQAEGVMASCLLPAFTTACKGSSSRPASWDAPCLISERDFPSSAVGRPCPVLVDGCRDINGTSVEVRECHLL